ncbi:hypothetical protein L3X38_017142 [Prunus dulcis]|uniref:Uncharacterized protein n=1 Tax=Prunus dulcis TaxID=3755 RepID=A0AAD4W796_PRUDU|nr:hypothetical protein L3X38_017142 [Prunus dulcis]
MRVRRHLLSSLVYKLELKEEKRMDRVFCPMGTPPTHMEFLWFLQWVLVDCYGALTRVEYDARFLQGTSDRTRPRISRKPERIQSFYQHLPDAGRAY